MGKARRSHGRGASDATRSAVARCLVELRDALLPERAAHGRETAIVQLLEAVAAVHDAGIIHRDISPWNVFVRNGAPRDKQVVRPHPRPSPSSGREPLVRSATCTDAFVCHVVPLPGDTCTQAG